MTGLSVRRVCPLSGEQRKGEGDAMNGSNTLLKAAKLWSRTSKGGNNYLAGRLGGVKVLDAHLQFVG